MEHASAHHHAVRRPLAEVVVDRIWRFFCSVRAAVYEIAFLAVLVLIGTLRGSSVPERIADILPFTRGVVDRWYDWDVFHSLLFIGVLTLISVAIAICTVNRAPGIWTTISHPTITTTRGFIRGADLSAKLEAPGRPAELAARLGDALREKRYRVLTAERDGDVHLYADRYRFAKLATFPFHLALILILIGGIVGARYGFRDNEFIIPEGEVREIGHGTGVSVELIDFKDTYRDNGTPLEYRSQLVLYKNGERVREGAITVNHPLSYNNLTFYQTSFGQAVTLLITDSQGRTVFDGSIPLGIYQSRLNPDAPAGVIELPAFDLSLHVIGPDNNPANQPELDTLGLRSGEMFVQVRPQNLDPSQMPPSAIVGQGDTVQLESLNIQFVRERQFTLLQVANNPGMPIFWTAAFLLVGGLAIVFYFPHRRIRAIVGTDRQTGRAVADLAGLAKRDWSGQRDFRRVCEHAGERLGVLPVIRERARPDDEPENEELEAPAPAPA
jgi:cytochrome c biogenesis protein